MVIKVDGKTVRCPGCKSVKLWNVGFVPIRSGKRARIKCSDCARTFYKPLPTPKKKAVKKPKVATVAEVVGTSTERP